MKNFGHRTNFVAVGIEITKHKECFKRFNALFKLIEAPFMQKIEKTNFSDNRGHKIWNNWIAPHEFWKPQAIECCILRA